MIVRGPQAMANYRQFRVLRKLSPGKVFLTMPVRIARPDTGNLVRFAQCAQKNVVIHGVRGVQ